MAELLVYAGGPIDYLEPDTDGHSWRHMLDEAGDLAVYCPVCVGRSGLDDRIVLGVNKWALRKCDAAVFVLDGPTIGTPLEVDYWLRHHPPQSAVIVHPGTRGLVVRDWSRLLPVVGTLEEALDWLSLR